MADISGIYALHGKPGYKGLTINYVDAAGKLAASLQDDAGGSETVHGTYDAVTQRIVFNDALWPGEILFTTFFSGSAIYIPGTTEAFALDGTWTEMRLRIEGRRILEVEFDTGSWYADCKQVIIQ